MSTVSIVIDMLEKVSPVLVSLNLLVQAAFHTTRVEVCYGNSLR